MSDALSQLSPLQRRYAVARTENPSLKQIECARLAGCRSTSPNGLRVRASTLEKATERARATLTEELIRNPANGAQGLAIIKLLAEQGSPDSVRLNAAAKLVELSGFQPVKVSEVHHKHDIQSLSNAELNQKIERLQRELGFLPAPIALPSEPSPESIDAEFSRAGRR